MSKSSNKRPNNTSEKDSNIKITIEKNSKFYKRLSPIDFPLLPTTNKSEKINSNYAPFFTFGNEDEHELPINHRKVISGEFLSVTELEDVNNVFFVLKRGSQF